MKSTEHLRSTEAAFVSGAKWAASQLGKPEAEWERRATSTLADVKASTAAAHQAERDLLFGDLEPIPF